MLLSDVSIKRPVFASVLGLLLVAIGIVAFTRLALREYPDIDPPIVSIRTSYPGASANVVETRITEVIEDRISGVEGIRFINSSSQDGQSEHLDRIRHFTRHGLSRQRRARPGVAACCGSFPRNPIRRTCRRPTLRKRPCCGYASPQTSARRLSSPTMPSATSSTASPPSTASPACRSAASARRPCASGSTGAPSPRADSPSATSSAPCGPRTSRRLQAASPRAT